MPETDDLVQQLNQALKTAMKGRDHQRMGVVRMLLSEIKSAQLGESNEPPSAQQVVSSYAKRLRKSADEYHQLAQADRAEGLERELAIVEEFLPAKLNRTQIEQIVDQVIAQQGITSPRQIGQVMKEVMSQYGDQVEGREVQEVVRAKLGT